jgi:hypothetical protein
MKQGDSKSVNFSAIKEVETELNLTSEKADKKRDDLDLA